MSVRSALGVRSHHPDPEHRRVGPAVNGQPPANGIVPSVRPTWKDSDRFVPRAFVRPALRFTQVEAAGGIVMLVAALAALVWANSPWHESYERFLQHAVRPELRLAACSSSSTSTPSSTTGS